jgi:alginate O-acetyltransferase complex protein AlgI
MLIVSLTFFGFSAAILLAYYLLRVRGQNFLLLGASYAFYLTWSWSFPLLLLVLTGVNFGLGRALESRPARRRWLGLGIAVNLGGLAVFKYADFFVPQLDRFLSPLGLPLAGLRILLPVGMSFYILQAIAYLVDVSRRQTAASRDFVDFALAMAYFPKLTSGPIERFREFLPKLARPRSVNNAEWSRSFSLIVIGLVRKIVIADVLLAAVPSNLIHNPARHSSPELIIWMLTYVFGLYNDFAGYTQIVRGISGLFGIPLSRNFAFPLFSRNLTEFWSRWHISLSNWLRDYIYFPLSRALVRRYPGRFNLANLLLPPLLTMAASGLWHGTGWHMLAWGLAMGGLLVFERIPSLWRPVIPPARRPRLRRYLGTAALWGGAVLAGVLFRASLPKAVAFWKRLFSFSDLALPQSRVFLVMIPALWIDWVQYRRRSEWAFLDWPWPVRALLLAIAALAVLLFSQSQINEPFIYQGF